MSNMAIEEWVAAEDEKHRCSSDLHSAVLEEEKVCPLLGEPPTSPNIRIAIIGKENVGKTTLCSVLLNNKLDDGHGIIRKGLLKHKHEK